MSGSMKAVLVGRHDLLEAQKKALDVLNVEIVKKVEQISDVNEFVNEVINSKANVVVIQALPISILAQILTPLQRNGVRILMFEMGNAKLFDSKQDAEKYVNEAPEKRVLLSTTTDNKWRVVEFTRVVEVKRIEIVTEVVYIVP